MSSVCQANVDLHMPKYKYAVVTPGGGCGGVVRCVLVVWSGGGVAWCGDGVVWCVFVVWSGGRVAWCGVVCVGGVEWW